jgi:hypothetical protein
VKVLCCGSRDWTAWEPIWRELRGLSGITEIVHGDCRGADKMCGYVAKKLGYPVHPFPADWDQFGRAAGMIRNGQMLKEHPDIGLVLAFHDNMATSRGTKNMVEQARAAGIPVNFIRSED